MRKELTYTASLCGARTLARTAVRVFPKHDDISPTDVRMSILTVFRGRLAGVMTVQVASVPSH